MYNVLLMYNWHFFSGKCNWAYREKDRRIDNGNPKKSNLIVIDSNILIWYQKHDCFMDSIRCIDSVNEISRVALSVFFYQEIRTPNKYESSFVSILISAAPCLRISPSLYFLYRCLLSRFAAGIPSCSSTRFRSCTYELNSRGPIKRKYVKEIA